MTPPFVALVPAAGRGLRYGGEPPKQWVEIAGKPVIVWTVERLLEAGAREVVVALPTDGEASVAMPADVRSVAGGATRQESVARCLAAASGGMRELVLVHDGVRPAVALTDIAAVVEAADLGGAAILGRAVTDTIKRRVGGFVQATVDRSDLFRAETPQVFRRSLLERALASALETGFTGTDEASLVECLGDAQIHAVVATEPNPKLTRPEDLSFLRALLEA